MSTVFIKELSTKVRLGPQEIAVLNASGVRNYASLYNFVTAFPSVAETGLNIAMLSSIAAREVPAMAAALSQVPLPAANSPTALGAEYPAGAPAAPGFVVPVPSTGTPSSGYTFGASAPTSAAPASAAPSSGPVSGGRVDVRPGTWPVHDQGSRGTCVAFAVAACMEHLFGMGRLSEQFLYWATKTQTGDAHPMMDGTHLRYAKDALASHGICYDPFWPYVGAANPANITYHVPSVAPSPGASADALARRRATSVPPSVPVGRAAQALWNALDTTKSPVAISLPVIRSPGSSTHNWNSPLAFLSGEVADPFTTGVCIGGHAVCVVGFEPDATEAMGGFFVIRNSWSPTWGTSLPAVGYYGPEQGYGQVSASYVNDYLWELCHL